MFVLIKDLAKKTEYIDAVWSSYSFTSKPSSYHHLWFSIKSDGDKLVSFSLGDDSVEKLPNALLYPIPRCPAACTHEHENHTAGLLELREIQGVMLCAVKKFKSININDNCTSVL